MGILTIADSNYFVSNPSVGGPLGDHFKTMDGRMGGVQSRKPQSQQSKFRGNHLLLA